MRITPVGLPTPIDSVFPIPVGAEDEFEYVVDYSEYEDEGELDGNDEFDLEVPDEFEVVAQKLRRPSKGKPVVDITVEISEVADAENYEIRVAKV